MRCMRAGLNQKPSRWPCGGSGCQFWGL